MEQFRILEIAPCPRFFGNDVGQRRAARRRLPTKMNREGMMIVKVDKIASWRPDETDEVPPLEDALAILIQNQAKFVGDMAEIRKDFEQN